MFHAKEATQALHEISVEIILNLKLVGEIYKKKGTATGH